MFYGDTYNNIETSQRHACRYDLFSQTVTYKEGHEQTNTILFQYSFEHLTGRLTYALLLPAT